MRRIVLVGTRPALPNGMDTRPNQPATNNRRVWQTISALRRRIRQERELLGHPGLEVAAARELARSQRRLEVLHSRLR
jgi:hypothetical protein